MIEQLTLEQTARFPEFIDKWTKIGLSTEPADRPRAEAAVRLMYKIGGLPSPEKIVWFDSPMAMYIKYKKIDNRAVWDAVRSTVRDAVRSTVRDVVSGIVRSTVRDVVSGIVRVAVWDTVSDAVWDTVYGSYEAHWLAHYDYYREVFGLVEETDKLAGLFELAKSCGWIIPCEKVCYASERHNILNLDSKGKLHCEDGPAIVYPDGWSIYADHGIVVHEKVVTDPSGLAVRELKQMNNKTIKIVLRKIGIEKFMSLPGTKPDTWTDLFSSLAEEVVAQ
jgi:hypothetical protein